jgi:hypothetical protein
MVFRGLQAHPGQDGILRGVDNPAIRAAEQIGLRYSGSMGRPVKHVALTLEERIELRNRVRAATTP